MRFPRSGVIGAPDRMKLGAPKSLLPWAQRYCDLQTPFLVLRPWRPAYRSNRIGTVRVTTFLPNWGGGAGTGLAR
jgi:hypothetical protein